MLLPVSWDTKLISSAVGCFFPLLRGAMVAQLPGLQLTTEEKLC